MAHRSSSNAAFRLLRQSAELAFAAPQVVAHRTARMAAHGAQPSERDRAEMLLMGSEKVQAFCESWIAMWGAAASAQWAWGSALAQVSTAALQGKSPPPSALRAAQAATHRVLAAGLKPVHGKAVANARRLARARR